MEMERMMLGDTTSLMLCSKPGGWNQDSVSTPLTQLIHLIGAWEGGGHTVLVKRGQERGLRDMEMGHQLYGAAKKMSKSMEKAFDWNLAHSRGYIWINGDYNNRLLW